MHEQNARRNNFFRRVLEITVYVGINHTGCIRRQLPSWSDVTLVSVYLLLLVLHGLVVSPKSTFAFQRYIGKLICHVAFSMHLFYF